MKALLKLILVLALCFAVLGQRTIGLQVDAIGVALEDNLVPYLRISIGGSNYLMNLKSIYEVTQDPTSGQWMKDYTTETSLDTLTWDITADLKNSYGALTGAPCPCNNTQEQEAEPFQVARSIGRQVREDPFQPTSCSPANFGYFRLVFQEIVGENNTACTPVDIPSMCTNGCNEFCANVTNGANCLTGCNAITNTGYIDDSDCNVKCNVSGVVDLDCVNGCKNVVNCVSILSCKLEVGFHLHKYQWSNSSTSSNNDTSNNSTSTRKLAFAFEIIPQSNELECKQQIVTWFKGPYLLWINTTSYAAPHQDDCFECMPDLSQSTPVVNNLFFAPGETSLIGRVYVDQFAPGLSVFNMPPELINMMNTNTTSS